jgi:16S rRNA (uracil1498-N3)-methyltransferase
MPQFYLAGDWAPSGQEKLLQRIDADLAHHLRVRRIKIHESFTVFDGRGHTAAARLLELGSQSGEIEITQIQRDLRRESAYRITLLQGLAGGDKMDWIVEKAVETGVSTIIPIECERSVLKLQNDPRRLEKRLMHWQAIARAACEQCDRTIIPTMQPIQNPDRAFAASAGHLKVLLSPEASDSFDRFLHPLQPQDITIAIGPEGGFSPTEEALAKSAGFVCLTLGPRVLRTETAGIVAITAIHSIWNLKN